VGKTDETCDWQGADLYFPVFLEFLLPRLRRGLRRGMASAVSRVRIGIEMDRVQPQPVKDPPNLIRSGAFTLDRLLSHIDPGPQEECKEFVRRIYEQRY
jgi:hypothetical protein